jgi:hypothetical protein
VPGGEEAAEHLGLHRLDVLAQGGERAAAQRAQHVLVAPLAAVAAGAELAFDDASGGRQPLQRGVHDRYAEAETCRRIRRRERPVRARIAPHQIADGIGGGLEQRGRQPLRQRRAEAVAVPRGIFHGDEPRFAGQPDRHRAPGRHEGLDGRARDARQRAGLDLGGREIAEPEQQVVHAVGGLHVQARARLLQVRLDRGERLDVDERAQFALADERGELRLIDRQRMRAPLGQRRVAVAM